MRLTLDHMISGREGLGLHEPLDIVLQGGEGLVIRGPNGVGKTTLLRSLAGFLPVVSGSFTFDGTTPTDEATSFLGHAPGLKDHLSPRETLSFWQRFFGNKVAEDLLKVMGIDHVADQRVSTLSAGQRRRLGVARLLVEDRPVWLLDEPTTALDQEGRDLLARVIAGHLNAGGCAIIATHEPAFMDQLPVVHLTRVRHKPLSDPFLAAELAT